MTPDQELYMAGRWDGIRIILKDMKAYKHRQKFWLRPGIGFVIGVLEYALSPEKSKPTRLDSQNLQGL